VGEASDRFRKRAKQCRQLAGDAKDDHARQTLTQMAKELDAEADLIDSEKSREEQPPAA
jgi:hypothetical protein